MQLCLAQSVSIRVLNVRATPFKSLSHSPFKAFAHSQSFLFRFFAHSQSFLFNPSHFKSLSRSLFLF